MPDPRFDNANAIAEDCTEKIALTRRVLQLFTNPNMQKLLPALEAVGERFQKYETMKRGKGWKQHVYAHMAHGMAHGEEAQNTRHHKTLFIKNLTAASLRFLVGLTRYLEEADKEPDAFHSSLITRGER